MTINGSCATTLKYLIYYASRLYSTFYCLRLNTEHITFQSIRAQIIILLPLPITHNKYAHGNSFYYYYYYILKIIFIRIQFIYPLFNIMFYSPDRLIDFLVNKY